MNALTMILLTLAAYKFSLEISKRCRSPLSNPLLISIGLIITLCASGWIHHEDYQAGTQLIRYWLGPATVVLAIPMYRQIANLKKHWLPITVGIIFSVPLSFVSIVLLSRLFQMPETLFISLAPKSITTPIGISLSTAIGGIPAITVASIVATGIFGAIASPSLLKLAKIEHPIAQGIAIGASSHVLGTTRAMTMGEIVGAMSSLSIALTGMVTYFLLPFLLKWLT